VRWVDFLVRPERFFVRHGTTCKLVKAAHGLTIMPLQLAIHNAGSKVPLLAIPSTVIITTIDAIVSPCYDSRLFPSTARLRLHQAHGISATRELSLLCIDRSAWLIEEHGLAKKPGT
jgi:hypothetical protein